MAHDLGLSIIKDSSADILGDGILNNVSETIEYTITIENTGDTDFDNVGINDPLLSLGAPGTPLTYVDVETTPGITIVESGIADGILSAGETWTLSGSALVYTTTQADFDSNGTAEANNQNAGFIDNTASFKGFTTADPDALTQTAAGSTGTAIEQNKLLKIVKEATVPGGSADVAGEVISYTMAVSNGGNAAIANVVVDDNFATDEAPVLVAGFNIGDTDTDGLLDVTETWQYTASHTVTQAELDAGGTIDNIATASGDGAPDVSDNASVPVEQNKLLKIVKEATVPGGSADVAGEVISYTMAVSNGGNAAIANVVVDDNFATDEAPVLVAGFNIGDTDTDGLLDVTETWQYTASHTVTQAELDAGGTIDNIATASGDGAPDVSDNASVPVEQNKLLKIVKEATVPGGSADVAGEVISYTMAVSNGGNAAIANVVVDDNFATDEAPVLVAGFNIGDTDTDGLLDVTETWQYTASHTVTQAELDAGGTIDNIATASGDGAPDVSDNASVPVEQNKLLKIVKEATVPGGSADVAGEVISYTMAVSNGGNAAIANVVVDDNFATDEAPVLVAGFNIGDTDTDGLLDVTETWQYTASHTVTQAELDAGGTIDNIATASGDGAPDVSDNASVPVEQNKLLKIVKEATVPGGSADVAGEVISYTMAVSNGGNAAIANVVVDDNFATDEAPVLVAGFNIGDTDTDGLLDVTETWQYTASHTVTQAELDAGGTIDNIATASGDGAPDVSDNASVPVEVAQDPLGQSPGFWKNHCEILDQELAQAFAEGKTPVLYDYNSEYEDVFGLADGTIESTAKKPKYDDDPTLKEALGARGGGEGALLRATTAAYLNAASDDLNYSFADASFDSVRSVLDSIDLSGDSILSTNEIVNAVQDIYSDLPTVPEGTDSFDLDDTGDVASALDEMNNLPHLDAGAFA